MRRVVVMFFVFGLFMTACQMKEPDSKLQNNQMPEAGITIEIDGKPINVDRIVSGLLCDDTWSGTIFVDENVKVKDWQETPAFLQGCTLAIEPGTVVYVAAHAGTRFTKGCSCHE